MFAIVKTGGKQYKVRVGETIDVEKLPVEEGSEIRLDQVLLAAHDGDVAYGHPVIDGAVVTARVARQHKGPKLIVFRYKSKSRYRRRTGHRQPLTQLTIQTIEVPGWETATIETVRAAEAGTSTEAAAETVAVDGGVEGAAGPSEQGSAAPPDDVLPVIKPTAQVEAPDGGAIEPTPGAGGEEPSQGLPGQGSA